MDLNKRKNDEYNKGTNTLKVYDDFRELSDRTKAEMNRFYGLPGVIAEESDEERFVFMLLYFTCLIVFNMHCGDGDVRF
ncbi:hypothetical protein FNV43_RR11382 [Rhamnella rubrinervis]|uniref:Uncharacterized protein n=1 Tax=Rhamnella rubrinervis TaxID=2594499 RepID=A0A8K0H6A0_9ROSA|nr:hypothetical protein FNV43_RR11382 [Rhamnella rubrinervis]